ncbi:hypothetical protein Pyn_37243 [Prunus yedoensis var. nudiflora]|uniref:Uncharacterized protein n=1 Tax=Prunus yedoensis var. nudiflora TaxID=2094558 RepID=A0A314YZT6_PRUYE|nr:hypothetical protein Pyn_37243 [Prunus yedoensis var. nudiflora]
MAQDVVKAYPGRPTIKSVSFMDQPSKRNSSIHIPLPGYSVRVVWHSRLLPWQKYCGGYAESSPCYIPSFLNFTWHKHERSEASEREK